MTNYTVEIYDPNSHITTDISGKVVSISYGKKIDSQNDAFTVISNNIGGVKKFNWITIKKNGVNFLSGIILNQKDSDAIKLIRNELNCLDWSYLFNRRSYAAIHTAGTTIDTIFKNVVSVSIPELTTNNVKPSIIAFADQMRFHYVYAMDVAKSIADSAYNWHWYVDSLKDVHSFEGYETEGVEFKAIDGKYNLQIDTLRVEYTGDIAANKLWIVGAKKAAETYIEQYFTGDGVQRYFSLVYEPNYSEVYVNGVLKDSNLEQNDDGQKDFLINKKSKVFYIPPNIQTPFSGTIKFKYKPTIQLIDFYENIETRNECGLLLENIVKYKNVTDKLSARQYGRAEIKRKAEQKRKVSFSTYEDVAIGQRCNINITSGGWNITGYYLVTSVSGSITAREVKTDKELKSVELEEI